MLIILGITLLAVLLYIIKYHIGYVFVFAIYRLPFVLIALAVLVLGFLIKKRNKKISREWALAGFMIGVLFPAFFWFLIYPTFGYLSQNSLINFFSYLLFPVILPLIYMLLKKEDIRFYAKVFAVAFIMVVITTPLFMFVTSDTDTITSDRYEDVSGLDDVREVYTDSISEIYLDHDSHFWDKIHLSAGE